MNAKCQRVLVLALFFSFVFVLMFVHVYGTCLQFPGTGVGDLA